MVTLRQKILPRQKDGMVSHKYQGLSFFSCNNPWNDGGSKFIKIPVGALGLIKKGTNHLLRK